jgi:hypothetical protein
MESDPEDAAGKYLLFALVMVLAFIAAGAIAAALVVHFSL